MLNDNAESERTTENIKNVICQRNSFYYHQQKALTHSHTHSHTRWNGIFFIPNCLYFHGLRRVDYWIQRIRCSAAAAL